MDITEFLKREISQNYKVNGKLGSGGCSIVYDAVRFSDNRRVAVKVLSLPETLEADEVDVAKKRFCREALLMVILHNPHVVECLDYGVFNGSPCIVLEFIEGKPLDVYIKEFGALPFKLSVSITCQLLDALECAHTVGVIHRDIKPGNILLTGDEDNPEVHLIDFGIASMTEGPETDRLSTKMGSIRGTPSYMAPELFTGFASASAASDLYAAGLVLLECLTGQVAINGVTMMEIAFKQTHQELVIPVFIPKCLAKVIQKSCAKIPDMRYASAREMSDALKEVLPEAEAQKDVCARAYMSGMMEIADKEKSHKKRVIAIIVAAVLIVGIAIAATVAITSSESDENAPVPVPIQNTADVQNNQQLPENTDTAAKEPDKAENAQNPVADSAPAPVQPSEPAPVQPTDNAQAQPADPANGVDGSGTNPSQPEVAANPEGPPTDPAVQQAAQPSEPAQPAPAVAPARPAPKTNNAKSPKKKTKESEPQPEPVKEKPKKNNMVIPSNLI